MTGHITDRADRFVRDVFKKPAPPQEEQKPQPKTKQDMLQRLRRRRDRVQRTRRLI
jgi:hypothetical protein